MIEVQSLKSDLEFIQNNPTKVLELNVGSVKVTKPGTYAPKADAKTSPFLSLSPPSQTQTQTQPYIAICIDLDAPLPSLSFLGPILHWIQTDLILTSTEPSSSSSSSSPSTSSPLTSSTPPTVTWEPAAPPPFSSPHRYLVLLYEQPVEFEAAKCVPGGRKEMALTDRIRFDYSKWVEQAGLGKLVAGNWFTSN